jgi:hypothetical protein
LRYISLTAVLPHRTGERPPGWRHSQNTPRHLLLSVLRI